MLIANRTSYAVVVELGYAREHVPSGTVDRDTVRIAVDDGPEIMARAHDVLYRQIATWNAQGRTWRYSL